MKMKKCLLPCLFIASLLLGMRICAFAQKGPPMPTVRIAINTWMGYVPLFVAEEKGFFKELNVETFLNDDLAVACAAYDSGRVDVLFASPDMLPVTLNHGRAGKCFFVTGASNGSDGIVASPRFKSLADLKGKRVAFVPGCFSHWLLQLALRSAGLDINAIQKKEVDTAASAGNALIGGSVDAAVTYEPYMTQIVQSGKGRVLATSRNFSDTLQDVWIGSGKFLADQRAVDAFIEGWLRAILYAQQHMDEAVVLAARGFHISPEDVRLGLRGVRFGSAQENLRFLCGPDAQGPKIYDQAAAFYLSEGVIKQKPPPASEVFTDQAAPVFERMVKEFAMVPK